MALGPGPAGLKFWTPQGLTADNTADINNLPAGAVNWFNPWGPKRPVQDWVWGNLCLYPPSVTTTFPAASGSYALTGFAAGLTPGDIANLPAGAVNWFNPWGPKRPVQDWFRGSIPAVPVILPAGGGSYTLTGGSAVTFAFGQAAAAGAYTLTGSAAALALGHVAGSGSYTLSGSNAALALGLGAGAGSYTLTGSNAVLSLGLSVGAGSYTITGTAATLVMPFTLSAVAGSYTLTGTAAGLVIPGGLAAAAGSYTLTGSSAALTVTGGVDYLPAGLSGSFNPWGRPFPVNLRTATGQPLVAAAAPVTLTAAGGSYTLTGADAAFVIPGAVTYLPAGMTGGYVPWRRPFPVNLRTATGRPLAAPPSVLTAAGGSYVLTGADAAFVIPGAVTYMPAGMSGGYVPWRRPFPVNLRTSTGRPLAAVSAVTLTAAAGSYTVTGSSAALALRLTANTGSYTVSGTAAVLARGFAAGAGAYAITGTDAQLTQAGTITLSCGPGSYLLTGSDVSFGVTLPVEVTPPPTGGAGAGVRVGRYRQFKLKKKRKHDQCEELLEYLRSLPPAEAEAAVAELPPRYLSLLDGLPLPHALVLPPAAARTDDDDDDDACALLLELLLR